MLDFQPIRIYGSDLLQSENNMSLVLGKVKQVQGVVASPIKAYMFVISVTGQVGKSFQTY